jgi:4-aminobutyrate aminotransferase/(S)-3-amino-2-methylpropionate transaminase
MPLAATIGRARIMDCAHYGGVGGTYGGNPLACVAALATIDLIERERLLERAKVIGRQIRARFEPLLADDTLDPLAGDVRGLGAMIGIELVKDRQKRTPAAAEEVLAILGRALERGVLAMRAGLYVNCIRLLVPLVITDDQLEEGLEVLISAFRQ